jgi:hypothetical protein
MKVMCNGKYNVACLSILYESNNVAGVMKANAMAMAINIMVNINV